MWVIIIYIATLVLTGILLYLLLKYLKEKPFGGQLVTDHLSIDLIISLFTLVLVTCVSVIGRELFGPFNSIGAETCLILQQLASSSLAFNLLSVQVAQFCSILLSVRYGLAFFKWANPGLFFVYFHSFQTNIVTILSIQYTVPGFEPLRLRVSSHYH